MSVASSLFSIDFVFLSSKYSPTWQVTWLDEICLVRPVRIIWHKGCQTTSSDHFLTERDSSCSTLTCPVPSHPYVSHRHCELLAEDDKFVVRDCNSTNGTFINSQRVEGQVELHEGDRL